MTPEKMYEIGRQALQIGFSDNELDDQILAINLVVSYLRGRGNSDIIVHSLQRELNTLNGFLMTRKQNKK
jgi:hypothetical protein